MEHLTEKNIAGTIILNQADGSKKFLVHLGKNDIEFAETKVLGEVTGLASILQFFKKEIQIDANYIRLIDLTNAHKNFENIPLFVFGMDEENLKTAIPKGFKWEQPANVKKLLESYNIEGVPMF